MWLSNLIWKHEVSFWTTKLVINKFSNQPLKGMSHNSTWITNNSLCRASINYTTIATNSCKAHFHFLYHATCKKSVWVKLWISSDILVCGYQRTCVLCVEKWNFHVFTVFTCVFVLVFQCFENMFYPSWKIIPDNGFALNGYGRIWGFVGQWMSQCSGNG